MKNFSVIIPENLHISLQEHLLRIDGQEDLCFATYSPSMGNQRLTGIITSLIFPEEHERLVHGNAEFNSIYMLRALDIAHARKEGLVFLHSHPFPGWQNMSVPDVIAEERIAPPAFGMTHLPIIGMTIGSDGFWSARFWLKNKDKKRKYTRHWCESVRVFGDKLCVYFNDHLLKTSVNYEKQSRTISSWGQQTQENISRLKVGIVGLGSVGSIVAEILARTGFSDITLIDFDSVEEKNLDRTLGAFNSQIGTPKVEAISSSILKSATASSIKVHCKEYSICEEEGYKAALDCDVLFSCVDRPWPRQVLNFIAYVHMIPVIDGGIKVRTNKNNTKLMGAFWRAHIAGINRPCLECLEQFSSEMAKLESEGFLDDPSYIEGMTNKRALTTNENVFVFSSNLASMLVLQFISMFVSPAGIANIGPQIYHMALGQIEIDNKKCHVNCVYPGLSGKGDLVDLIPYGYHKIAEEARESRKKKNKNVIYTLLVSIVKFINRILKRPKDGSP